MKKESESNDADTVDEAERILAKFFTNARIISFLAAPAGDRKTTAQPSWVSSCTFSLPQGSPRVLLWKPPRVVWGSSGTHAAGDNEPHSLV